MMEMGGFMYPYYLYSDVPKLYEHKVWAEIDVATLSDNYKILSELIPNTTHICVVKADAYGHTSQMCVNTLLDSGCRFFAVSCIEEAMAVRAYCNGEQAEILILGYTDPLQVEKLVEENIIQTVISEEYASRLSAAAVECRCRPRVHVALDTGMNRIGICARTDEECDNAIEIIEGFKLDGVFSVEGLFSHFAQADEDYSAAIAPESRTRCQFAKFDRVRRGLIDKGIDLFAHICNSAAALRFPEYALDGVRLGISLYGIAPSSHFEPVTNPVMSLHTVISHIHKVPVGERVSYGGRYAPESERTVATLPIGYADGFQRAFRGFHVTVHTADGNFKAPVVGSICMDQCMIDVTDLPVSVGNKVTVFGYDRKDISTLAKMAETIEYEILCLVSARVPRVLKNEKMLEDR